MKFPFSGKIRNFCHLHKQKLVGPTTVERKATITTNVPGAKPIELPCYYEEFVDYYPNCELHTKQWLVENIQKDWVILDCGANIGYFSILMARQATDGHVYAFEPTDTYEMLNRNIAHCGINNITTYKQALGTHSGDIEESIFRIWGKDPEKKSYSFTTVDDFVSSHALSKVDCIKIDVDSFDFEVAKGAQGVLSAHNPFVIIELNHALNMREQNNMQALEWFAEQGYGQAVVLDYDNFLLKRDCDLFSYSNTELTMTIGY